MVLERWPLHCFMCAELRYCAFINIVSCVTCLDSWVLRSCAHCVLRYCAYSCIKVLCVYISCAEPSAQHSASRASCVKALCTSYIKVLCVHVSGEESKHTSWGLSIHVGCLKGVWSRVKVLCVEWCDDRLPFLCEYLIWCGKVLCVESCDHVCWVMWCWDTVESCDQEIRLVRLFEIVC